MTAITVTDSKGQQFTLPNRAGRKLAFLVIGTYPAAKATTFAKASDETRCVIGAGKDKKEAIKIANHNIKTKRIFDVELIEVK